MLQNQRLKVARFDDMNDPFELLAADLSDRRVRRAFVKWKTETSKKIGLVCFSMRWRNPLLWSHYADRHRGVALEFEIDDDFVVPVRYSLSRLRLNVPHIISSGGVTEDLAAQLVSTKSKYWAYEEEVRVPVTLSNCVLENGLHFEIVTEKIKVVGVILGALSQVTSHEVRCSLPRARQVTLHRSRIAVRSFSIVRNKAIPVEIIDGTA